MIRKIPEREVIRFTPDEYDEFIDCEDGYRIISDEILDHSRWAVIHSVVIERLSDNTFWRGRYSTGATECQEHDFEQRWHSETADFMQVFPKTITVVSYE